MYAKALYGQYEGEIEENQYTYSVKNSTLCEFSWN